MWCMLFNVLERCFSLMFFSCASCLLTWKWYTFIHTILFILSKYVSVHQIKAAQKPLFSLLNICYWMLNLTFKLTNPACNANNIFMRSVSVKALHIIRFTCKKYLTFIWKINDRIMLQQAVGLICLYFKTILCNEWHSLRSSTTIN